MFAFVPLPGQAGQSRFDPHTGRETTGQFDSTVRFELVKTP
jgi:hypothetical protein